MSVEAMYHRPNLYQLILQAMDKNDPAGLDEFHIGGRQATLDLAAMAYLQKGMKVLDLGCGLGGPARLLTSRYNCIVTGIDLTAAYIDTAKKLSDLTGEQVHFVQGNALDLPFDENCFDVVWTQHVQMNISDKKQFYAEAARVLKPGGQFVYYDVLSAGNGPIQFPVPWATDESMSFLITAEQLHHLLQQVGFVHRETEIVAPPPIKGTTILIDEVRMKNLATNFHNHLIQLERGLFIKP